ncbi:MAG: hypothetical protein IPM36_07550 [Lewinellaceae bacterium]|nr:hypothetical protein [Lewinellaceae bacterium]
MSVFLKHKNWLVSDWVIRKFNRDVLSIDSSGRYDDIKNDLERAIENYTHLLNYSDSPIEKISRLNELASMVIAGFEKNKLQFEGEVISFESYLKKLSELYAITAEEVQGDSLE